MLKSISRARWLTIVGLGLILPAVVASGVAVPVVSASGGSQDADLHAATSTTGTSANVADIKDWSLSIWQSALSGNQDRLEQRLQHLPGERVNPAERDETVATLVQQFEALLTRRQTNMEQADRDRITARDEALAELDEHFDENDLSQALRLAVEIQTLSDDMESALEDPQFKQLIAWSQERLPQVEKERDWLQAQELLFLLRTLYEDTSQQEQYASLDSQLETVNQRVALLARYAPKRLHQLRQLQAERLGDEPIGEYKPSRSLDWHERLEDISHRMVRTALRTSAREHIESDGYEPLLVGGLESLRTLATTPALDEAFPALADETKVQEWLNFIDSELKALEKLEGHEMNGLTLSRLLDNVVWMNERTLDLPLEVIYHEFGEGAMNRLDRFSEIVWPAKMRRFEQAIEGNFVGVGILIRENDKQEIVVVNPLEGAPAYFAGIKPEDIIVEVDGEPTVGWTLNDAVDRITGERNTDVTLGIRREGHDDLIPITITRDVVKLRSVKGWKKTGLDANGEPEWNWYIDPVTRVGYVRLTQFTEDTTDDLLKAWEQMNDVGAPRGIILDLRYNPGGLLDQAVSISNLFVERGEIVSIEDKLGNKTWAAHARPELAEWANVPVVVLINKGSASASEIVSGALQAHDRAVIIGERSFGKGSVQTLHRVTTNSLLKLTTQYYRLPSGNGEPGRLVHKRQGVTEWGVDPDIVVPMTPDQIEESILLQREANIIPLDDDGNMLLEDPDRRDINDLLVKGLDPQLEMALLILQARALGDSIEDTRRASLQ